MDAGTKLRYSDSIACPTVDHAQRYLFQSKGNPGISEFGRFSIHSYKYIKNIKPLTRMYEDVKEVRIINANLDLIEKKLESENIERKKIRKELLKIEENKKMIGYEKKKLKREDNYLK